MAVGYSGGLDESQEDHRQVQSEMDRLDAEIKALRSMFFQKKKLRKED